MELKSYQQSVIDDVKKYIEFLSESNDCSKAYNQLWDFKGYRVGTDGIKAYKNTFKGVPDVCMKVPTGGGKTFIACAALKTIFNSMPRDNKIVLWMVPSSAILEQTKKNLRDPNHPYRQRLNADFSGQINVYDVEELLNGQNFNPQIIQDQLSICILSYSSMRASNPDNRRMYRQNGALFTFNTITKGQEEKLGDSPSLMGIFNALSPVIVLDESHNAGSTLTKTALESTNPSFILELTATPKKDSNIITIVTAATLKKENMVKIPLIVYGRPDVEHVIYTTIDYRKTLEAAAQKEFEKSGRYVRPIALIQAQPKIEGDAVTFEEIKKQLVKAGIPEEQIAIKVSNKDELKNVDLLSKDCPVRFIITVNALKEGWDCPFAYVLSSIARRSSDTEVEQIIGRILRQPNACKFDDSILNMSYVITSSKVFHDTLDEVSKGLQAVGFTKKDYRAGNAETLDNYIPGLGADNGSGTSTEANNSGNTSTEDPNDDGPTIPFDPEKVKDLVDKGNNSSDSGTSNEKGETSDAGAIDPESVRDKAKEYEAEHKDDDEEDGGIFTEFNRKSKMKTEFVEDATSVKIPKFMYRSTSEFFGDFKAPLSDKSLTKGFKLSQKDRDIDFSLTDINAGKWELRGSEDELKYVALTKKELDDQRSRFREVQSKDDAEVKKFANEIITELNQMDDIETPEIKRYVEMIIDDMSLDTLNNARKNTKETAGKIKDKIKSLAKTYRMSKFEEMCTSSDIVIDIDRKDGFYKFPEKIDPHDAVKKSIPYAKSLYEKCQGVSGLEERILQIIDRSDNVLWWHRVVASGKDEFSLNGPIGHYPDFIARTKTGVTILIEAKGSQLNNPDTKLKIKIGQEWEKRAGSCFKYYMVFENEDQKAEGSISSDKLEEYLGKLKP